MHVFPSTVTPLFPSFGETDSNDAAYRETLSAHWPELAHRTVLLTNATRGLGPVISHALAAQGARLIMQFDACDPEGEHLMEELRETDTVMRAFPGSMPNEAAGERLAEAAQRAFGTVGIIINNLTLSTSALIAGIEEDRLEGYLFDALAPQLAACEAAAGQIRRTTGSGVILNIAHLEAASDLDAMMVGAALEVLSRGQVIDWGNGGLRVHALLAIGKLSDDMLLDASGAVLTLAAGDSEGVTDSLNGQLIRISA